jgi:hypothetical protein
MKAVGRAARFGRTAGSITWTSELGIFDGLWVMRRRCQRRRARRGGWLTGVLSADSVRRSE